MQTAFQIFGERTNNSSIEPNTRQHIHLAPGSSTREVTITLPWVAPRGRKLGSPDDSSSTLSNTSSHGHPVRNSRPLTNSSTSSFSLPCANQPTEVARFRKPANYSTVYHKPANRGRRLSRASQQKVQENGRMFVSIGCKDAVP